MARQVITTLIDDLDGKKADRTVEFSLDGISYTIDLSEANAGKLRKALDPYINAGTRLGRSSGRVVSRRGAPTRTAGSRDENRLIREWALANGRRPRVVDDGARADGLGLPSQPLSQVTDSAGPASLCGLSWPASLRSWAIAF